MSCSTSHDRVGTALVLCTCMTLVTVTCDSDSIYADLLCISRPRSAAAQHEMDGELILMNDQMVANHLQHLVRCCRLETLPATRLPAKTEHSKTEHRELQPSRLHACMHLVPPVGASPGSHHLTPRCPFATGGALEWRACSVG